jgi:hypothetical protein
MYIYIHTHTHIIIKPYNTTHKNLFHDYDFVRIPHGAQTVSCVCVCVCVCVCIPHGAQTVSSQIYTHILVIVYIFCITKNYIYFICYVI